MNLRPPVPTSDKLAQEDSSKQHRAALVPVVAGLAIVLGLAGYTWFHQAGDMRIVPYDTGQMLAGGDPFPSPGDMDANNQATRQALTPQGGVDEMLLLREGDRTLTTEPAEIEPHPNSRRISGFARTDGHVNEEFSYARVGQASVQEVVDHYVQAAELLNFQPLADRPAANGDGQSQSGSAVVTRILIRQESIAQSEGPVRGAGQEVLIIRARPTADGEVYVSLWHRSILPMYLPDMTN